MIRRLPLIPTIIVVAAAIVMMALGVWQLGRAEEKAAMIARFEAIPENAPVVSPPFQGDWQTDLLYRQVSLTCAATDAVRTTAGTSERGAKGWSYVARCPIAGAPDTEIALGWSRDIREVVWEGGEVRGLLGPGAKIVANPALSGLDQLAAPDPSDLPNNHLAYAGQWFFFALTALVIYGFAVQARIRRRD